MCLAELGAKDTYLGETSEEINVEAGGSELSLHSCSTSLHVKMMSSARGRMGHLEFQCGRRKVKSIRGRETGLISSFSTKPFFFLRVVRIPAS
jgi:hypothetical protein